MHPKDRRNFEFYDLKILLNLYFIDFPQTSKIDPNILYACIFDAREAYIKGVLRIDTRNFSENKPNIFLFPENVFGTAELQTVVIRNKEYLKGVFTLQIRRPATSIVRI